MKLLCASVFFAAAFAVVTQAADSPALTRDQLSFFEQKIRPVLAEHCYECHSTESKKLKGGLYVDSRAGLLKGGESGKPSITPGDAEHSLLITAIRHTDPDLQMPPKKKLTDAQIADLVAWVKQGAPDPREGKVETKRADKSWWSLQKLAPTEPPTPEGLPPAWAASPIDRFVFTKLAEKRLAPNPPADPRSLIRRMTYDLTGLPPTPEEVEAFAAESIRIPNSAIQNLVDRLLASPRYGEHWGRHWLDVVRFGESIGFERNGVINNAWPFRDYVIRSLNDDKPFNQFIIEHLAGDVVGKDDPNIEIGTTFLVAGPYDNVGNQDPVAAAQIRANTIDDMITATGTAFLGITINCARCHNHKFDPIPQEDYYRLQSAFAGVKHGDRVLAKKEDQRRFKETTQPLNEALERLTNERNVLEKTILERDEKEFATRKPTLPPLSPELVEEKFSAIKARFVQLKILAQSANPKSGVSARIDEFEVWTAGATPRNVALATNGGKASGAAGRSAENVDEFYGVNVVNDGKYGVTWFAGRPPELTIEFAQTESIDRITFSNIRGSASTKTGPYVTEYAMSSSLDGTNWTPLADSYPREPINAALAKERALRRSIQPAEKARLAQLSADIAKSDAQLKAVKPLPLVWAGTFSKPKEITYLHKGGDPQKKGPDVAPSSLAVLDGVTPPYQLPSTAPESDRRLALAKWIASDDNPLTARVLANRIWHYHFGTGIVDSPSDFGFLGGKPTHPELLEWLALRLQQNGWHLKALHREILLSQTYRQSAAFRTDAARQDKDARLLWRFPPRRLDAEEIRDTLLTIAGKLDTTMGGPGFRLYRYLEDNVSTYVPLDRHGPETYRRAVYHQNARASIVDLLTDFDAPDVASAAPRRSSTTTPLQALTMLNHAFTLDMADALSSRLEKEAGTEPAAQTRRAFTLAFGREPNSKENTAAVKLIRTYGLKAFCRALLNANELIYLE